MQTCCRGQNCKTIYEIEIEVPGDRNLINDVRGQANKFKPYIRLRVTTWRNKYILIDSKVRIYKTCTRAIVTCVQETHDERSKTNGVLRKSETKAL